jgi:hypothetical protein
MVNILRPPRRCVYCNKNTRRGAKGEHIVPDAIGGALTLNDISDNVVCGDCNNGVLSQLDNELCRRSYLSIVAAQEMDSPLKLVWDVDHTTDDLMVEAGPRWLDDGQMQGLVCYPQIIFEKTGPAIRGDSDDVLSLGEDFTRVLVRAAKRAFERYRRGEDRSIHLERVRTGAVRSGCRLAPRLFTPRPIKKIAENPDKHSFTLRYVEDADKIFALRSLEKLQEMPFRNRRMVMGSRGPTIACYFDMGVTLRGLMKIGVNLIAAYCQRTPVNVESFTQAIPLIRGKAPVAKWLLQSNGFIHPGRVKAISGNRNCHAFRLVHDGSLWIVYSSFFGGRIGACASFPGPNYEHWKTLDIKAPLCSKNWVVKESQFIELLPHGRVEWTDSAQVCPSFPIRQSACEVLVEYATPKPPLAEAPPTVAKL